MKIRSHAFQAINAAFWFTVALAYIVFTSLYIAKGLLDPNYCIISGGQVGAIKLIRIHK